MPDIRGPSRQIYTGQLVDNDIISGHGKLHLIGQMNPVIEERWRMSQGRSVAGLGMTPEWSQEERRDDYLTDIEKEDDVYGSGIFDPSGRPGTIHPDLGVFSDHPGVPGYINREVQFAVSKDVVDVANGADVVVVPAGGMAYVERDRQMVGPLQTDAHNNPYVVIERGDRGAGKRTWIPVGTPRTAMQNGSHVAASHSDGGTVLSRAPQREVQAAPIAAGFSSKDPQYGVAYQAKAPIGAFGDDASQNLAAYLVTGAVVGIAAGIFYFTLNPPGMKRA